MATEDKAKVLDGLEEAVGLVNYYIKHLSQS